MRRVHAVVCFAALAAACVPRNAPVRTPGSPTGGVSRGKPPAIVVVPPVLFEANAGRTHSSVSYLVRRRAYALFITPRELVFSLGRSARPH